jgi:hypothetical protein
MWPPRRRTGLDDGDGLERRGVAQRHAEERADGLGRVDAVDRRPERPDLSE